MKGGRGTDRARKISVGKQYFYKKQDNYALGY
jgi:hypothetical protein